MDKQQEEQSMTKEMKRANIRKEAAPLKPPEDKESRNKEQKAHNRNVGIRIKGISGSLKRSVRSLWLTSGLPAGL
jgi:hypothetical protein